MHLLHSIRISRASRHRVVTPTARRRRASAFVAAILVTAVAAASAALPAAAAAPDATWDVATIDGPHGTNRANYDYSADAGERIEDSVLVANTSDAPIELDLYAADGFTTEAGQFDLRTKSHAAAGVGAWSTLATDRIVLQAGEEAEIPFAVTVPDDAQGEYVGGIVTSAVRGSDAAPERRAAIRVRLHVGASFAPSLAIEEVRVDYSGAGLGAGEATVSYTVRNAGDTMLASGQEVTVAGPFGMAAVTVDDIEQTPALLPGESWRVSVPVHGVAPLVSLVADVEAVPLYTDPAGSTGPLAPVEVRALGWAVPWVPLLVVVAVLGVIALALVRGRRSRRAGAPTVESPETPESSEENQRARAADSVSTPG